LPDYMRWSNGTDPCHNMWLGVSCGFDEGKTPTVEALELQNMDLSGLAVPRQSIAELHDLNELSLSSNGLVGTISPIVCIMTSLQTLSLQYNHIRGLIPNCLTNLSRIEELYLNDNHLRGPLPLSSELGRFIADISAFNLDRNHWTAALPSEKAALGIIAGALDGGLHDWDTSWRYDIGQTVSTWTNLSESSVIVREHSEQAEVLTIPFHLPFFGESFEFVQIRRDKAALHFYRSLADVEEALLYRGCYARFESPATAACTFREGRLSGGQELILGHSASAEDCAALVWRVHPTANAVLYNAGSTTGCADCEDSTECHAVIGAPPGKPHRGPPEGSVWHSCFFDGERRTNTSRTDLPYRSWEMPTPSPAVCARHCRGYAFMGLSEERHCSCGNNYGGFGEIPLQLCGEDGSQCGRSMPRECTGVNAVFELEADQPNVLSFAPSQMVDGSIGDCSGNQPAFVGCFADTFETEAFSRVQIHDMEGAGGPFVNAENTYDELSGAVIMGSPSVMECVSICEGWTYIGLQASNQCWCGNEYGSLGPASGCGYAGRNCGNGDEDTECQQMNAVFRIPEPDSGDETAGICEHLPVSMVSVANSSDAFIVQWNFDGGDASVEVQVSIYPDGQLDMHARVPTELQQTISLGTTGIYGEAERSEESMSMAGSHGFVYVTSDPCIDDWTGVSCGTVPWPPGQDECEDELDCVRHPKAFIFCTCRSSSLISPHLSCRMRPLSIESSLELPDTGGTLTQLNCGTTGIFGVVSW
jgi:hypothetical protein